MQPLEQVGNNVTGKEENKAGMTAAERSPLPAPPASVEHLLPGGIGTYSISYFNQRVLKPDGSLFTAQAINTARNDENSNSSSYTGNGFTLWDESVVKKGKTGKENIAAERHILQGKIRYISLICIVLFQWLDCSVLPVISKSPAHTLRLMLVGYYYTYNYKYYFLSSLVGESVSL